MGDKRLIVLGGVLLLIIGVGILYFSFFSGRSNVDLEGMQNITLSAIYSGDVQDCDLLEQKSLIPICRKYVAVATRNDSLCFSGGQQQTDDCLITIAYTTANSSVCSKMTEPEKREFNCPAFVAGATGDRTICESFLGKQNVAAFCYLMVVRKTKNISVCENTRLDDGGLIDYCYLQASLYSENASICDKMTNLKDLCIVISKNDVSLCEKLSNEEQKISCYNYLADNKHDPRICDRIDDPTSCYLNLFIINNDTQFCGSIKNKEFRVLCNISITSKNKAQALINKD
jgi:hypothetical protein